MYFSETMTTGYNVEHSVRLVRTMDGDVVRVFIRPNFSFTSGTGTIQLPVQTYPTYTLTKVTPAHPKNWRWFDGFRLFKPYQLIKCVVRCPNVIRRVSKQVSLHQLKFQKRKMFVQDLRRF